MGTRQIPSALIDGKRQHRQSLRVEEGIYKDDVFKFHRIWEGDETDWGLNFAAQPVVLRVFLSTYSVPTLHRGPASYHRPGRV